MQGSMASWSYKAVNIGGVMVLGRPAPFDGALVDPKRRRFARMWRTAQLEHSAILATVACKTSFPLGGALTEVEFLFGLVKQGP
jgi:hypothetical protein